CKRETEQTMSATYLKDDEYNTLFLRKGWDNLYVGRSETGGRALPPQNQSYTKVCDTTVTQPGLVSAGGMCEIFRLADGSFLIFDSGNPIESSIIWQTLCQLHGSENNIRICAWVMTHSHGDHYGGFKNFANTYADKVKLDYVLYSPLARQEWDIADSYDVSWNTIDYYFNGSLQSLIQEKFAGTVLASVHAGQVLTFADVSVEILYTPEFVYMEEVPVDTNNTSIVSRVVNSDGSMMVMADCGAEASQWIYKTYDEELKSDLLQATHHGMLTGDDLKVMRKIKPTTYFFPCSETKFNEYWGVTCQAKQYAISGGEIIHYGHGAVTRKLSYRGTAADGDELLRNGMTVIPNGITIKKVGADGIVYTVKDASDPYVAFATDLNTEYYNSLLVTVKCPEFKSCSLWFTSGDQTPFQYISGNSSPLGPQGASDDGFVKLVVYLGDGTVFDGNITSIRIDLGTVAGQEITIQSVKPFYVDVDGFGTIPVEDDETDPEEPGEGNLPRGEAVSSLIAGDGMECFRYTDISVADFEAACLYFTSRGYTEYCYRDTANTMSATYLRGDTYNTLFYRKGYSDLILGLSETGGLALPPQDQAYTKVCETTFTQPGLLSAGGMCEIFRLADGSFLIFDSGNPIEHTVIWNTLCQLNGSDQNIRICAWVLTHSHGDHYGGFRDFAGKYADKVQLDYVLYSPMAAQEWAIADSYNVSWNTIDYYFNGPLQSLIAEAYPNTTLASVHAGQTLTFADVTLEILYSFEHVYINGVPVNTNDTSLMVRVYNEDGSVLITGDCETEASVWVDETYTQAELKSDYMQAAHHGMITTKELKIMKKAAPTVYFFPCNEATYINRCNSGGYREANQYAAENGEIIHYGHGTVTRPLAQ
ncbi:MAG: MBL fold metallo-hydrolase, partial [Clostridia bacterium]|nr:MBL fold metallo-hydrolase [Clostridia bacterium]